MNESFWTYFQLENEEEKLAKLLKIKNFKIQGREDEYQVC